MIFDKVRQVGGVVAEFLQILYILHCVMAQEDNVTLWLGSMRDKCVLRFQLAEWFLKAVGNGLLRINVCHDLTLAKLEVVRAAFDEFRVSKMQVILDAKVSGADVLMPVSAYGTGRFSVKIASVKSRYTNFGDDAVVSFV